MEWLKINGDRFALLVVALITIGATGMMIAKSFSFADDFVYENVTGDERQREVPPTGTADVEASKDSVDQELVWSLPSLGGKPAVPLFTSVVRIQQGKQIFDPTRTGEKPLRPPMTNEFLLKYRLDYTRTDVGTLDKDDDGFSNIEEFIGVNGVSTDPTDKESRPPLTNKLFVQKREEIPYYLVFQGSSGDLFQVREERADGKKSQLFVKPGQKFFDRFTALNVRTEDVFNESTQSSQPTGILTVKDEATGENIELIQRKKKNLPTFIGVFLYTWRAEMEIQVKQGDTFKISGDPRTFKLVEIMDSEALIVPVDEEGKAVAGEAKIRIASISTRGAAPSTIDPNTRPLRPTVPGTTPPVTPVPGTTPPVTPVPGTTPLPVTPVPGTTPPPVTPVPGTTPPPVTPVPGTTPPVTPVPGATPPVTPVPGTTPVPTAP